MLDFFTRKKEKTRMFALPLDIITDKGVMDISRVKVGASVLGWEDGEQVVNRIEAIDRRLENGDFYCINETTLLFANQTVIANGNGTHAKLLKVGDTLYDAQGRTMRLDTLKRVRGSFYFYKLKVSGNHTYFLNNTLVHNASRYRVGGTGTWDASTTTGWSTSSGGGGGASVPSTSDDVIFNGSSGGGTCTRTATTAIVSLTFTGFAGTFAGSGALTLNAGGLIMASGMTRTYSGAITFTATSGTHSITSATKTFAQNFTFNGSGGTWQFTDSFTTTAVVTLTAGTLNGNGQTLTMRGFSTAGSSTRVLNLGSGTWNIRGFDSNNTAPFNISTTTNLTVNASTSTIKMTGDSSASGLPVTFAGNGQTFYNLWFSCGTNKPCRITGANTFNDIKDDGATQHELVFPSGSTTTTTTLTVNGTSSNYIAMVSSTNNSTWTLSISSGTIAPTYVLIKDGTATGGATFSAGTGAASLGNNSGWTFPTATSVAAYAGTGADDAAVGTLTWSNTGNITASDGTNKASINAGAP